MTPKMPASIDVKKDVIAGQQIYTSEQLRDEEKVKMLLEIRNSLKKVLFRKEYAYTKITEYLALLYESITDNPFLLKVLNTINNTDPYTFTHSINTAVYSMSIAIWMGLNNQQIINATQAGLIHDAGKIFIPSEILNKKGPLKKEEYDIIKKHTLYGYFLVSEYAEFHQEVKRAVLFHHERTDLTGYPLNASPDCVGLISKIVAVADVYDAMTTDRVYKKGISPVEAMNYLKTEGIKKLDNQIIDRFLTNIPIYDFKYNKMKFVDF